MEAIGIYYEQLAWYLFDKDCSVSVVLPNKAKKYKESLGLKSKTDKIDAQALARMCCEQIHTPWKPISKNIYALRVVTRNIESICDMITATACRP
jgi:transposase